MERSILFAKKSLKQSQLAKQVSKKKISNTDFNQLIHNLNSNRLILIFICISY